TEEALIVESDDVAIEGLSITGAKTAIALADEASDFAAADDWIGIGLTGATGANGTGIFVGPGSTGVVIGGIDGNLRNVIAGHTVAGLALQGAADTEVLGNYFGTAPNGTTKVDNNVDLEATGFEGGAFSTEIEIGTDVGAEASTPACDGGCNVFASKS